MIVCHIWSTIALWIALVTSTTGTHQCNIHQMKAIRERSAFIPRCQANLIDYAARQCMGEICTCATHEGINITEWSTSTNECACPVAVHELLHTAARSLAAQVPVCTEEGRFVSLLCDNETCWSVDEVTGERDFHSHVSDVEVDPEIEGLEQAPVGRTARRRRSLNDDAGILDDEQPLTSNAIIENAHITVNEVGDVDGVSFPPLPALGASSSAKGFPARISTYLTTEDREEGDVARPIEPSPAIANVPTRASFRQARPIPYMRRNAPLVGDL